MSAKIPHFETMEEPELNYIKAGISSDEDSYKTDASLSKQGLSYAEKMGQALLHHRDRERQALIDRGGPDIPLKPLKAWTSTRKRTIETAQWLFDQGYSMSEGQIRLEYPDEVSKHEADPYHHRYPRAESYHDLAVRLEPIILELERQQDDLLIIAHESVLRVLYGYLMACNATDIPRLSFPRNEIIEIIPASYNNEATRIPIPGLPEETAPSPQDGLIIPGSPSENPSGTAPPITLGSPAIGEGSPRKILPSQSHGSTPTEPGLGSALLVERALRD
ncbi:MAG: hypothetical protein Q9214_001405 [Letrouitia sp. 1 TL-2023]